MTDTAKGARSEAAIAVDTRIDGYRIRGLLGEGAMGQVYLAQDLGLGRRVALKLIKREVMSGDGVERFLVEARTTAIFNHPHIVTVHGVGEYDGRPYLALEYVDGESLRSRINSGPTPVREALRICRAIAEALSEAHHHGVVHADLKPENVLVRRDGRVRVLDFGLAKLVGAAPSSTSGTPAYMAPERWRGEPPTGAIDVWACGTILAELITGRRPIADAALARLAFVRPGDPETKALRLFDRTAPWMALAESCLQLDPKRRPDAAELLRGLDRLIDPRSALAEGDACPFPGLAAFTRAEAAQYYGRDAELDEVIERLRTRPLVPIIGPSGIGKSSFVQAALIPRLAESGWTVVVLRPGDRPLDRLAAALELSSGDDIAAALRAQPEKLSILFGARGGFPLLVVVDQFEEAFTLAGADALALCDCLALSSDITESWRVVLTIRDDFLGRLAESEPMRAHLGAMVMLAPLGAADLRAAIMQPLANAGYELDDPDLVDRIVDDVDGQAACLPLLQFACQQLWERRESSTRRILSGEYEAMGGAIGALARHAQQLTAELSRDQVRATRTLLLALLNPDGTRRPQRRSQLLDGAPEIGPVLDRLLERRLVFSSRESEHDETRIELAHESLATTWPQLRRWVDETSEQRLLVLEIEQASLQWRRREHRDDATWGGAALAEAVRRIAEWNVTLPVESRAFLDAGLRRARRQRRTRRWVIGAVVGVLAVAATGAAIAAVALFRNQEQIRLAAGDLGRFELALQPYDWDFETQTPRSPGTRPVLTWKLRAVDPTDARTPGRLYDEGSTGEVRRHGDPREVDGWIIETVEARAGPAFIEIHRGEGCDPSVLPLQHLPGFRDRGGPMRRISIRVPTCQASSDVKRIEEGVYYRNLNTEPGQPLLDVVSWLPTFSIDRTEVTRGAYDELARMRGLIGGINPPDSTFYLPGAGPTIPMLGVTFFDAIEFCRFHGKALPSLDQWQKAFRGGVDVGGKPNPDPRRTTPWVHALTPRPANTSAGDEGDGVPVSVATHADDESPDGVRDLGGNAAEWTTSPAVEPGLRALLGGGWPYAAAKRSEQITWRNARPDAAIWFEVGFRCVVPND